MDPIVQATMDAITDKKQFTRTSFMTENVAEKGEGTPKLTDKKDDLGHKKGKQPDDTGGVKDKREKLKQKD